MHETAASDSDGEKRRGTAAHQAVQRIESGLIAVFAMTATIVIAPSLWWFPLAVFLAFDLSMLGYTRSPAAGAASYNAVHTYAWSAALGVAALLTAAAAPTLSTWLALTALAWAFHVGVDRMLGYGLKLPDAFTHTHLGAIGRTRDQSGQRSRTPAR
ncbi:DUF4260 family protein [Agrococcus sp. Ld7]|uniref:DUF4260 family protein n=1 Tax=Agrococcus sp. Ld7 TaxID=649148 RepID=UPI00386DC320